MDRPKYEVRVTLMGDDWPSILRRIVKIWGALPAGGEERHLTGSDSLGVTYTVDVSEVEVVSEPPAKVRA